MQSAASGFAGVFEPELDLSRDEFLEKTLLRDGCVRKDERAAFGRFGARGCLRFDHDRRLAFRCEGHILWFRIGFPVATRLVSMRTESESAGHTS